MAFDPSREKTEEDPIEDYILERDYSPMRKSVFGGLKSPYLWAGIVGAVLLICIVMFSLGGESTVEDDRLFALEDRLSLIEERISELERVNDSRSEASDAAGKLDLLEKRINRIEASVAARMDRLNEELARLDKAATPPPGKKTEPAPETAAPEKKTTAVYHLVKPGETLYGIGKKYESLYGTNVKKLRELNKLGENDPIIVGRKLLVRP